MLYLKIRPGLDIVYQYIKTTCKMQMSNLLLVFMQCKKSDMPQFKRYFFWHVIRLY